MAWKGVITNAGNSLLGQWTNGAVLCIAGAAAGTGVVDEVSMMAQTALKNQIQTVSIASCDTVNGAKRLRIQIPAADIAYPLNQIGIFARIGDGEAQLLALYQNSAGVGIPTTEESPDFLYTFYGLLGFDNTGELKVTIDSGASVTMEALSEELAKHTNEQAPTFAQAEKLENISSGEKMTTLMGKIMKALADLISHLSNKNNPHGVSAEGIGAAKSDHGNHVPDTETADNAKFLRNDNTWQKVTPENIGAAPASHGNHVPATETADNAKFLRNDNTWQKVTPANIGASATGHKHTKSEITDFPSSMTPSSHTQAASTVTAGTFAGQVVANSSGQTPGTSLLRNSKLVAAETNPTVNGEICWTYE